METRLKCIQATIRIFNLICLQLYVCFIASGQHLEGNIQYDWQSSQRVIFNGPYKDAITIGDSVTLIISGTCDLRPYEVEKKRGGFLGIGKKRYRELVRDPHSADNLNIYTGIEGTSLVVSQKLVVRKVQLQIPNIEAGSFFENMNKEFSLYAFIQEPGKNLIHGSANLTIRMEIDSYGRIEQLINYLKRYPTDNFIKIRELLEKGVVMKQYPNELCEELFKFYSSNQQDLFVKIKTDLLDYLLMKSPNNLAIRTRLAKSYLEDKDFLQSKQQAKITISEILSIDPEKISKSDRILLADNYTVLGQTSEIEELGTQINASQIAVSFYKQALLQLTFANLQNTQIYRDILLSEVKALQRIGSSFAFHEAAQELENYLSTR